MNTFFRADPDTPASHKGFAAIPVCEGGFTLVELLIAMTLTAVIGMVLFSTYGMVMDNGKAVRTRVVARESERIFRGILDNDIAGLCVSDDKNTTLPLPSRQAITLSETFYRLSETDRPDASDDTLILSFATSSRLTDTSDATLSGPVCVEYVLRTGTRTAAFIRRERDFCGVDGEFPWSEMVLVRDVQSLGVEAYSAKTDFVSEWPFKTGQLPEAVRFTLLREGEEKAETFVVPVFPRRTHVER